MKYKNTRKSILIISDRESVGPFAVTRDYTQKDIDSMPGLDAAIRSNRLVPFDGKDAPPATPVSPRAVQWQTEMSSGTPVRKTTSKGQVVEYVVADSDTNDAVSMSDPDSITTLSGQKSSDYIEEGLDARQFAKDQENVVRSASDAFDEELDKENLDADFDDEVNLSEGEHERNNIQDVDEDIAHDMSQAFVKNSGSKGGQKPVNVQAVVEQETARALSEVSKATQPNFDDAEVQAGAPAKVVDFLKKNFSSKKWEISKSTDRGFLEEVSRVTQSENVRSLAQQRLGELPKAVPATHDVADANEK